MPISQSLLGPAYSLYVVSKSHLVVEVSGAAVKLKSYTLGHTEASNTAEDTL